MYQVKLYRTRDPQSGRIGVEAVGGGGPGDAVRLDSNSKGLISIGFVTIYFLSVDHHPVIFLIHLFII